MKQIEDCFNRFFTGKSQKKVKWQVHQPNQGDYIVLFHYNHMALMIDPDTLDVVYEWEGECPTDKRGIKAALEYLNQNKEKLVKQIQEEKIKATIKKKESE